MALTPIVVRVAAQHGDVAQTTPIRALPIARPWAGAVAQGKV